MLNVNEPRKIDAGPQPMLWMIIGQVLAAVGYLMITYSDTRDPGARSFSAGVTLGYVLATGFCFVFMVLFVRKKQVISDDPKVLVDRQTLIRMATVAMGLILAESLSITVQGAKSIEFMMETALWKCPLEGPYLMLGGVFGLWWNRMMERTS